MKTSLLFALALFAAPVLADTAPADDVKAAAKKLAEASSYAWTTTTTVPDSGNNRGFRPGPTDGKTEKDGYTVLVSKFGERSSESILKAGKHVTKSQDGAWRTPEEARAAREARQGQGNGDGDRRRGGNWGGGRALENFKAPAQQAEELAAQVKELKKDGDVLSGDLNEEAVKSLLSFRGPRRDGSEAPAPTDAKGTAKFWVKDGVLAKFETHVTGKVSFRDNEVEIDRTTTTEIKEVGSAKVEVPEEAKAKL